MTQPYSRPDGKNRFQIASASERPLFSSWLDQEFNSIYWVLNGLTISDTVSASEWTNVTGTFTQGSSTSFSVPGNLTSVFEPLRAIQFTDGSNATTTSHIQSSSYTSGTDITTVVVYDAVVPATISKVTVGLISDESASIPSSHVANVTDNYTVGALDKIILVDDSLAYTHTQVYDDEQVGGDGYAALLLTLPQPSVLPNKLICVKKIAGSYKTIISAHFTHSTTTNSDNETVHHNTYDFQILGENSAKNRVTLEGTGDCYWLVSNGTNWYELTPEASETVKGISRFATSAEMTLTAQQIADGEELSKKLTVSPYNIDKIFLRTDASNMRFASNYIYTAPNGVADLVDNNIIVYSKLGLNVPTGRDDNGVITTKKVELNQNITFSPVEVTDKLKLMFVTSTQTLQPILAENYYIGYSAPKNITAQLGDKIIWFDFRANLLKQSTDNGSNWTTFDGAGPICEFYGNGANITNILSYGSVGFLTRDEVQNIYQQALNNVIPDTNSGVTKTAGTEYTAEMDGWIFLTLHTLENTSADFKINGTKVWDSYHSGTSFDMNTSGTFFVGKGQTYLLTNSGNIINVYAFYPCQGAIK